MMMFVWNPTNVTEAMIFIVASVILIIISLIDYFKKKKN